VKFAGGEQNLFVYAQNDPLNMVDPSGLLSVTDFPEIPQPLVDFSAGLGDAILLGFGDDLRTLLAIEGIVDECSSAYSVGGWAAFGVGASRLGYAALVKGYSIVAPSGAAASAFRSAAKNAFRLGLGRGWRKPDLSRYHSCPN